jgi:hypothetical protein
LASVSFQFCNCGLELKIMKLSNDHKQIYSCECGQDVIILGTILDLHYRRTGALDTRSKSSASSDWIKADSWRIRD